MKSKVATRKRAEAKPIHPSKAIEKAWRATIERRVAELESGRVKGIPGHKVFSEVRRILKQIGVQKTRELLSQRSNGGLDLSVAKRIRSKHEQEHAAFPCGYFLRE